MYRLLTWALLIGVACWTVPVLAEDEAPETPEAPKEVDDGLHPRVKMETSLGDIIFELEGEKAPITVLNFIQYAEDKFYDGLIFHRVIKGFMIQGGGFTPDMNKRTEGLRSPIKNEWKTGLKNEKYTIAMGRRGTPDSAVAQFYINVVDNGNLDRPGRDGAAYCAFGKVVEGMEVVEEIRNVEVKAHAKYRSRDGAVTPVEPVVIKTVTVISGLDRAKLEQAVVEAEKKAAEAAAEAARKAEEAQAKAKEEIKMQMGEAIKKAEEQTEKKVTKTASGLAYIELKAGDGSSPLPTETVDVHYTGWLVDGTKFDSSVDRGAPAKFGLNRVIKGWTEGVGLMKVGAKWKLIIPPDLAYGASGRPSIPPNSVLTFDVELLSIQK